MICAVYCRKSTEQSGIADEQKSVARQLEHATAYATRKGWTVADEHVYIDDGISGAEFANRPGFLRLMNALKPRPPFQVLVISDLDRLGRESIETPYAIKQLNVAGVRVFAYLEDKEIRLDSPIEALLTQVQAFGAALEREKARQRTYDAMSRKAKAGHVTGGRVFGYDNLDVLAGGQRSHVERRINETEATVIRRIFQLSIEGHGVKAIAKRLNAEGARSPRAQRGRSQTWAPSSVREVLYRDLYRGVITWNRTRKRNQWGQHQQGPRPAADWIDVPAPELQIVSEETWSAAHSRLADVRKVYLGATGGHAFGRPALGNPSKYLLTTLALCGCCGGPLKVCSRAHGKGRKHFYGCSWYHERGRVVCANNADVPMADADEILIEALLDDVLDETMVAEGIDEAVRLLRGDMPQDRLDAIDRQLATVEQERGRLVAAIASGGQLSGLLEALREREDRKGQLEAERAALVAQRRLSASETGRVREELTALAASWRRVLADDPMHARPIVSALLVGRVTITPRQHARNRWTMKGEGTLIGLFTRIISPDLSRGMASPTGTDRILRPSAGTM